MEYQFSDPSRVKYWGGDEWKNEQVISEATLVLEKLKNIKTEAKCE